MLELINFIETRGHFVLDNNWEGYLTPRIEINVDGNTAKTLKEVINNLDCPCYLKDYVPDRRQPYTRITILGIKRCQKFLSIIIDSLKDEKTIKKAKLILNYCNHRLITELKEKRSQEDYKVLNQLKQLDS